VFPTLHQIPSQYNSKIPFKCACTKLPTSSCDQDDSSNLSDSQWYQAAYQSPVPHPSNPTIHSLLLNSRVFLNHPLDMDRQKEWRWRYCHLSTGLDQLLQSGVFPLAGERPPVPLASKNSYIYAAETMSSQFCSRYRLFPAFQSQPIWMPKCLTPSWCLWKSSSRHLMIYS
jgi:hypothetical protein